MSSELEQHDIEAHGNDKMRANRLDQFDWYDAATDTIKCLECSRMFQHLTTHLRSHGMTGQEYRERWGIYRTTPLANRRFIASRAENMQRLRALGVAVVSPKGTIPTHLIGKSISESQTEFVEFTHKRTRTSQTHKGKTLSKSTRAKLSAALTGREAHNKTDPVQRECTRCSNPFTCMRWQPNKFCSKRCAMLVNQNWLKRTNLTPPSNNQDRVN